MKKRLLMEIMLREKKPKENKPMEHNEYQHDSKTLEYQHEHGEHKTMEPGEHEEKPKGLWG